MSTKHKNHFENPSGLFLFSYNILSFFMTRSPYKKLLKEMNLQGNESVLEFGSGVGSLAKKLSTSLQNNGHLVCIDVSEKFLDRTKKKLRNNTNVNYILGEISTSEIPEKTFDVIVSTWVLHHVKDSVLEPSIEKFSSILKPQGKIYIIEFPDSEQKRPGFNQEKLLGIFNRNGFKEKTIFTKKRGILYEFSKK